MSKRSNRELVMLAHEFEFGKNRMAGMMVSEKMDGMRAVYVPETVGLKNTEVPWANMAKTKKEFTCTGLWSRYGHPIMCPKWFTSGWPTDVLLDGELWIGRQSMQHVMSAVRKHEPIDHEWTPVKFYVFDRPPRGMFYQLGKISNPNYIYTFDGRESVNVPTDPRPYLDFETEYKYLKRDLKETSTLKLCPQILTDFHTEKAEAQIKEMLQTITDAGGEGLMIRYTGCRWQPIRSKEILKLKAVREGIGEIIGYKSGLGKHQGRIGSLRVRWSGHEFDLAGFTDDERELQSSWKDWANLNPGVLMPSDTVALCFSLGQSIAFNYRETTDDGIPKEGRYKR